jgi:hypothetical protein
MRLAYARSDHPLSAFVRNSTIDSVLGLLG